MTDQQKNINPKIEELADNLHIILPALNRVMHQQWHTTGRGQKDIYLLLALSHRSVTQGELQERFDIPAPSLSRAIDSLFSAGLIERTVDSQDRRRQIIQITSKGEELLAQLHQISQDALIDVFADVSEEKLEIITEGCAALSTVVLEKMNGRERSQGCSETHHRTSSSHKPHHPTGEELD
ncbi:MAG: MarR family transcriptional regulator [Coriobacteriia bacterium]|nr:MarR family transcriptional regulator [Coriobacteriia bacterium]